MPALSLVVPTPTVVLCVGLPCDHQAHGHATGEDDEGCFPRQLMQPHESCHTAFFKWELLVTGPGLSSVVKAWCDHHQVPAEEATFLHGNRVLKAEDAAFHARAVGWVPTRITIT